MATGASSRIRERPFGSTRDGSRCAAEVSTLVIPANGEMKA
jgi:hypothetical protein